MNDFQKYFSNIEVQIFKKVIADKRISNNDGLYLFESSGLEFCAYLANIIKERKHKQNVFYNKNVHIELTNICENKCRFCSFFREENDSDSWNMDVSDALEYLKNKGVENLTEVHITGALYPEKNLNFYIQLFSQISEVYPHLHIKALTAVEIEYIAKIENLKVKNVIQELRKSGLNSLAGGGAEILDDRIRDIICPGKTSSQKWLDIHRLAHEVGVNSNCTMLFGHIETYKDRIAHLDNLRNLQDITEGFNCFIPLKFNAYFNELKINREISLVEELKNYAVSRIYLDNIPHLKAYWPMCSKDTAFLSLNFGVDDIDGTINDSTKIYSMAGSKENKPQMSVLELKERCDKIGLIAKERDSEYNYL